MAATSIFVNGKVVRTPGSYSEVDASGLNSAGVGALGIVAVLGEAEGGRPISSISEATDIPRFTRTERMVSAFRSGDLKEVADMLFSPAKDADILSGASSVIACKTNPSTQSTATLQRSGVNNVVITSRDYGAFTEQINVEIATGSVKGKAITVRLEDFIEQGDNVGGDNLATLQYAGGALGYNTAAMAVNDAGDITISATRAGLGQSNLITTPHAGTNIEVVSSSAADTAVTATIFGLQGGVATRQTVVLTGTTPISLGVWNTGSVYGVLLSAAAVGTVTLRNSAGAVVILDLPPATISEGLIRCEWCHVDRTGFSIVADGATVVGWAVFGRNASGAARSETGLLNNAVPVASTVTDYAFIDFIVVGAVPNTRTVTVTPTRAARSLATTQTTLQKAKSYFDSKVVDIGGGVLRGFIFTFGTGATRFAVKDLDTHTATSILSPATGGLHADQYAVAAWLNANSNLVTATTTASAAGGPDNTSTAVFLSGGVEGVALFTHYQAALNLLKDLRVNTIVDLSGDPAVAAAVDAHCAFMCGIGRDERDAVVGALNAGMTDVPSLAEFKAAGLDLNSRHMRVVGQAITRFNTAGEQAEFLPPFMAAIVAGMQAGSPVGTPLTHKFMNILALRSSPTWSPTDDSEELIEAGLLFAESKDGLGRRIVRNITTHLTTDNIAFTEASVNQSINVGVYEFRTRMEERVGKRGFAGTVSATRGISMAVLGVITDNEIIAGWRGLDIELALDVLDISVEMAPVIPINFVRTVIHLVTLAQLAAGNAR